MAKGQSFLSIPDKTSHGETRHLNVVITVPDDENNVLVVPACTYHENSHGQDESCLLPAGCHPFIIKKSYISYSHAKEMSLIAIFNGLHNGRLIEKQDFDSQYIQDMQKGAEISPFLPGKFKRFFEYFL